MGNIETDETSRPVFDSDPEFNVARECGGLGHRGIHRPANERVFGDDDLPADIAQARGWQSVPRKTVPLVGQVVSPTPDLVRQRELVEMHP